MRNRVTGWIATGVVLALLLIPLVHLAAFVPRIASEAVYSKLIPAGRTLRLLARTVLLGACATLVSFAFGVAPALFCARTRSRWRRVLLAVALATLLVPPYVLCYSWMVSTGPHGLLAGLAGAVGLPRPQGGFTGFLPTVFVLALWLWPVWTLILQAGLRSLDPALEESGIVEAPRHVVLVKVTAPAIAPHALAAAAVVFILASSNYSVAHLLGMPVYATELLSVFQATHDYAAATAVAFPNVIILVFLLWGVSRYERKTLPRVLRENPFGRPSPVRFKGGILLAAGGIVAVLSLGIPLVTMLRGLLRNTGPFMSVLAPLADPMGRTLLVSCLGATAVTVLAAPVAVFSVRSARCRRVVGAVSLLAFAVPGTLIGIGLVRSFNRPGVVGWVYGSVAIVVIGFAVRFFYVGWRIQLAAFGCIDTELIDAARSMGAGGWQMLRRVFWPMGWTAVAAGWVLTFVLCSGELSVTMNVAPPGWSLLPGTLLNLMHYGRDEAVLGACLVMVCLGVGAAVLFVLPRRQTLPGGETPGGAR